MNTGSSVELQNAVDVLLRRVPAFAAARVKDESYMSHDDDAPYLVFGDLARLLIELIRTRPMTAEANSTIVESFDVLNDLASSTSDDIKTLVEVGILEVLTDSTESVAAARQYLSGEALKMFEQAVSM